MIVITSKTLQQVGLDLDAAIGLLNPDGVEDVVHVNQILDAPPSPSPASLDPTPQATAQPFTSPVIAAPQATGRVNADATAEFPQSSHGGQSVRPTYEGAPVVGQPVPTNQPTNVLGLPRLPEHGLTFFDLQRLARALHAEAQVEEAGKITLVSFTGSKTYDTLAEAAAALNRRSFT